MFEALLGSSGEGTWACPACTLVNNGGIRCDACGTTRPGKSQISNANSTGVVVVLPPGDTSEAEAATASKRRRVDDSGGELGADVTGDGWACPACTLLNPVDALRCRACDGVRWALPSGAASAYQGHRPVAAAALRAARHADRKDAAAKSQTVRSVEEWAALPPAPDGHKQHKTAKDDELDMFGDSAAAKDEDAGADASGAVTSGSDGLARPQSSAAKATGAEQGDAKSQRPLWGLAGGPLFSSGHVVGGDTHIPLVDEAAEFADAVARLATLGYDPTKCHLALEAAQGDENVARAFLAREG
eukprot:TRINITY_DN24646_c0_g2_i1.p1 TRINITY_DN24646_c0_g2~~TRINITY_DN24646_c0_g2_i1.p1  ORF type:complete len:322 (+),score=56.59 TRINITY_DN24646_c0_g2_i1:62-967(+)